MVQPKMMAFQGYTDVETTGLHEASLKITMKNDSRPEVSAWKEIHLTAHTMFIYICSVTGYDEQLCHVAIYQFQDLATLSGVNILQRQTPPQIMHKHIN